MRYHLSNPFTLIINRSYSAKNVTRNICKILIILEKIIFYVAVGNTITIELFDSCNIPRSTFTAQRKGKWIITSIAHYLPMLLKKLWKIYKTIFIVQILLFQISFFKRFVQTRDPSLCCKLFLQIWSQNISLFDTNDGKHTKKNFHSLRFETFCLQTVLFWI